MYAKVLITCVWRSKISFPRAVLLLVWSIRVAIFDTQKQSTLARGSRCSALGAPALPPPTHSAASPPPPPPPWPQPPNPNPELQPIAQFANADPWHNSPTQTFWLATTARRLAGQGAGREEKGQSAVEPTRQTPHSQPLDFQSKVLGGYADLAGDHGHSCPEHVASCLRLQAVALVVQGLGLRV